MWIARNKDNSLFCFNSKPIRTDYNEVGWHGWVPNYEEHSTIPINEAMVCDSYMRLCESSFQQLKWEDEPEEIVISLKNPAIKHICCKCGKEFKYHREDIKEWNDCQPSSGYEYGTEYVNCPYCEGYNELYSW